MSKMLKRFSLYFLLLSGVVYLHSCGIPDYYNEYGGMSIAFMDAVMAEQYEEAASYFPEDADRQVVIQQLMDLRKEVVFAYGDSVKYLPKNVSHHYKSKMTLQKVEKEMKVDIGLAIFNGADSGILDLSFDGISKDLVALGHLTHKEELSGK
ncbi:hypothetical protein [Penaeicola halotolerans]|uniref:hypothetical protein n=1 Tax=Penaeicola halotolerans TaxID=2793196 RepID=UPI001CF91645|nr:hypothetical protein [Penaeicola halotolerans]